MKVAYNPGQRGNVANSAYFGIWFIPNLRHCFFRNIYWFWFI